MITVLIHKGCNEKADYCFKDFNRRNLFNIQLQRAVVPFTLNLEFSLLTPTYILLGDYLFCQIPFYWNRKDK
jgi:hypothetical protein